MKSKKVICCLLAICLVTLFSCGIDASDYTDKVVGNYDIKVTPNLTIKYGNSNLSITAETATTTAVVTAIDDSSDVTMQIDGVNGVINEMFFEGYCDGLGMKFQNNHYDGLFYSPEYGMIYCDIDLKNPTISISNSRVLSWESTVTGTCEVNISGLDNETYTVSGKIQFYATGK